VLLVNFYSDNIPIFFNSQRMVSCTRPCPALVSSINQKRGEAKLSYSRQCHHSKQKWVIVCLQEGHLLPGVVITVSITPSGSRRISGTFEFCSRNRRIKSFDCGCSALPERLKWNSRRLGRRRERCGLRALADTRSTYTSHGGAEVPPRLVHATVRL